MKLKHKRDFVIISWNGNERSGFEVAISHLEANANLAAIGYLRQLQREGSTDRVAVAGPSGINEWTIAGEKAVCTAISLPDGFRLIG